MPPATRTRVLIAVKTYPSLSRKYGELVCTAGFRDDGSWVRIYPIPFRNLDDDKKFELWRWIEVDLVRNDARDHRPESFRVANLDTITLGDFLKSDGKSWRSRREVALKQGARINMDHLIRDAHDRTLGTSLATFKPTRVLNVFCRPDSAEWSPKLLAQFRQGDLFRSYGDPFSLIQKIPWRFYIHFADEVGKESRMMVEDWGIGMLYRNGLKAGKSSLEAAEDVCAKIRGYAEHTDFHLFLGTSLRHHYASHNPFMIIGLFYPKFLEPDLFDQPPGGLGVLC